MPCFLILAVLTTLPVWTLNFELPFTEVSTFNQSHSSFNGTSGSGIDHKFYESFSFPANEILLDEHWINIRQLLDNGQAKGELSRPQLHDSYRNFANISLGFKFPFYGEFTDSLTIATGGFCALGETEMFIAVTQYIAPLMANFETTNQHSGVLYADTGEVFVVEWSNLTLRNEPDVGPFWFQTVLHKNGNIWFLYKQIPISVENISDSFPPVTAGISDSYVTVSTLDVDTPLNVRWIVQYDHIELENAKIRSNTVIKFIPKPVCTSINTCQACNEAKLDNFQCSWCSLKEGGFCSDQQGLHRKHYQWTTKCEHDLSASLCA